VNLSAVTPASPALAEVLASAPGWTANRSVGATGAVAETSVVTVAESLPGTASRVPLETCAVLTSSPSSSGAVTSIVNAAASPAPRLDAAHVTVSPDRVQPSETLSTSTPAGSGSVTTTPVASSGPLFVTTSEYENPAPGRTSAGPAFDIARSAPDGGGSAVTFVVTSEESFAGNGSTGPPRSRTSAWFVTGPGSVGSVATRLIWRVVPKGSILPRSQVTTGPDAVHSSGRDATLTPFGSRSVTRTDSAASGPLLWTTRL